MSNIASLFTKRDPAQPNASLVSALQDRVRRAECGDLQSFVGAGFTADGMRAAMWSDHHNNVYEMMGALAWLQAEYVHRHTANIES